VVCLFRIGPIPFSATNYACGFIDGLTVFWYCVASNLSHLPFLAADVYFGKSLKGLADLIKGEHLDGAELAIILTGFLASVALAIGGVHLFRRELRRIDSTAVPSSASDASACSTPSHDAHASRSAAPPLAALELA